MSRNPWLWFVAGPNGAGKSTYAPNLSAAIEEIVGPDAIAEQLSPTSLETAALSAGRAAIRRIRNLLKERRSFAVETTLSGRFHLQLARSAKSQGWNVGILYIGLRNPELAIERVRQRRLRGGHDVPSADVRRRYERSLRNLPVAYQLADLGFVLDNSSARRPMKRLLAVRQGIVIFRASRLPSWLRLALVTVSGRSPNGP